MKKLLVIFWLIPLFASGQTLLTAEDAIRIGLKNNYDIQISRNNAAISRLDAGKGKAGFLPTLDALGNYQQRASDQETNSPFGVGNSTSENLTTTLSLNWTLFDGFRMFANRQRLRELAKRGEYQSRNQIENTVVGILGAYFNLVQQEQLLEIARNARDISEARLNKARVRQEVGGASSADLLNAQVAFNNDAASVLNQELQVTIARTNLNILLGKSPDTPITVEKNLTNQRLDWQLTELQQLAQKKNSYLNLLRQNQRVARENIRLAKSAFYPRLSLNASYGFTDSNTAREIADGNGLLPLNIETQNRDATVGMTLSFNLFNGFQHKIDLQKAQLDAQNQALALENLKNQLAGWVQEKYETFKKQLELVKLEAQNVEAAQQNLNLQQDRYNIGVASSLEFRDAQVNLIRAQTTLIASRYQARVTRLEIEQLIGKIAVE